MNPSRLIFTICQKQFTDKSNLLRHVKEVHDQMRVSCDQCDQAFVRKFNLKRHIFHVHGGMLPYECDKCRKTYIFQDKFIEHMREKHSNNETAGIVTLSTLLDCRDTFKFFPMKREKYVGLLKQLKSFLTVYIYIKCSAKYH